MQLEAGRTYRAKTSAGDQITFVVISNAGDVWPLVNLDSADGQGRQRVIEALERTNEEPTAFGPTRAVPIASTAESIHHG